ncbi:MAG: hypothetical protein ACRD3S_07775, partial [Terracidiphilus sp.]
MPYTILFGIECLHAYFSGGPCRSISLAPAEGCETLLGRYGLLFRSTPGGCTVYAPPEPQLSLLRQFDETAPFTFRLTNTDPLLDQYTDLNRGPDTDSGETLFHFDNAADHRADVFGAERQLLLDPSTPLADAAFPVMPAVFDYPPDGAAVAGQSLQVRAPLSGEVLWQSPARTSSAATRVDLRRLPEGKYIPAIGAKHLRPFYLSNHPAARQWGAISIYIGGQKQSLHLPVPCQAIDAAGNVTPRTFTLALESRKTYWRYYVIDAAGKHDFGNCELTATIRNPSSRSASPEIAFLRQPEPATVGGRSAWVFEAQTPLPLLHSPTSANLALALRPA